MTNLSSITGESLRCPECLHEQPYILLALAEYKNGERKNRRSWHPCSRIRKWCQSSPLIIQHRHKLQQEP